MTGAEGREARGSLRLLSLNLRHGRGRERRTGRLTSESFARHARCAAELLRDERADVVALQEVDAPSRWSGSVDHAGIVHDTHGACEMAHGIHFDLTLPGWRFRYGSALLGRQAFGDVESWRFGTRPLDTKGFVVASVDLDGRRLDVASAHLDIVRSSRVRQAHEAVRRLRARERPLVLMGDLNSTGRRTRGATRTLIEGLGLREAPGDGATYPSWRPRRRLDWILVSPEIEVLSHWLPDGIVSDHRAVAAEVAWRA